MSDTLAGVQQDAYAESQKIAFDFFMNTDPAAYQKKIKNLKTGPLNLDIFEERLVYFCKKRSAQVRVSPLPNSPYGVIELIIPKENIINVINYFVDRSCLCVKICFGLDKDMNPQAIVSGSFVSTDGAPRPDQVDSYYTYKPVSERPRSKYFLNFGQPMAPARAKEYLDRFRQQAPLSDLHGYILDIATYRFFLSDEHTLGQAKAIRLRFGMNHPGDPETPGAVSGRAQIMMLELAPANGAPGAPIYLCSSSIRDDDEGDCPPRQPCHASA